MIEIKELFKGFMRVVDQFFRISPDKERTRDHSHVFQMAAPYKETTEQQSFFKLKGKYK